IRDRPRASTLFPYTTLFRSRAWKDAHRQRVVEYVLPQVQTKTQAKTWTCFEQHVLHGRPCAEVAVEVGISANAVCVNAARVQNRSEEHTSELQSQSNLVCRL